MIGKRGGDMPKQPHVQKNICGAKTRKGTPCKNPAGFRTNHLGEGKCYLHGGLSTGPPKKNKNAEKHGLFSKYLPNETMELMDSIENLNPLDILWDNIKIQYAAIIRSQQIMYVKSKEELNRERKKAKYKTVKRDSGTERIAIEEEFEIQFAWDRQANFLQAQSRAMSELRSMIKQYDELCKSDLATEEQKARIDKIKADINKLTGTHDEIEDLSAIYKEIYGDTDGN
jgi:uncharacterized protein YjcR